MKKVLLALCLSATSGLIWFMVAQQKQEEVYAIHSNDMLLQADNEISDNIKFFSDPIIKELEALKQVVTQALEGDADSLAILKEGSTGNETVDELLIKLADYTQLTQNKPSLFQSDSPQAFARYLAAHYGIIELLHQLHGSFEHSDAQDIVKRIKNMFKQLIIDQAQRLDFEAQQYKAQGLDDFSQENLLTAKTLLIPFIKKESHQKLWNKEVDLDEMEHEQLAIKIEEQLNEESKKILEEIQELVRKARELGHEPNQIGENEKESLEFESDIVE